MRRLLFVLSLLGAISAAAATVSISYAHPDHGKGSCEGEVDEDNC
jgi:hypothetical protein